MFRLTARLVSELAAALRLRPPSPPVPATVTQPPRTPDPYVWTLPSPRDARWRRWHRRKNPTALHLPEGACWQSPVRTPPPRPAPWTPHNDPVRLYVLQAEATNKPRTQRSWDPEPPDPRPRPCQAWDNAHKPPQDA